MDNNKPAEKKDQKSESTFDKLKDTATKLINDKDVIDAGKTIGNKVMSGSKSENKDQSAFDKLKDTATNLVNDKEVADAGKMIGGKVMDAFKGLK